jgi:hypothetical protein
MVKKKPIQVPWYKPGPEFKLSDAFKKLITDLFLTFIAGGLVAIINAIEDGLIDIPQELIAYTGLILAILHSIHTVIANYKKGL